MTDQPDLPARRHLLLGAAAAALGAAGLPAMAASSMDGNSTEFELPTEPGSIRNNVSSFRMLDWRSYFDTTKNGVILVDITSRCLNYWSEDLSVYRLYPTSVPLTEELTRRGQTSVIKKVVNPSWTATAGELERFPDWPKSIPGGSPDNPLGVRALYLDWPTYRIHGTHDTRKIGRRSSNGCIGLYNEHILELFDLAKVGTQVVLA